MEVVSFRNMVLMVMIMITMMGTMAKSEMHYVGGNKISWSPKVNLTEWSIHEHFYVGDWLYFGYEKHMYNVLEVNKTSYESCMDVGFISNVTRGSGRDVFQLTQDKTYYFLSGGGFCWQGLKVAINVEENVAPSPHVPPKEKSSSTDSCGNKTLVVLALVLMWSILFK